MSSFPLLPLRDIVVFPGMVVPLFVGRDKSVAALEAAMEGDKDIFLLTQLEQGTDEPGREDLYEMGVVAQVLQLLKLPDGTVRVLVEGQARGRLLALREVDQYVAVEVALIDEDTVAGNEVAAMMRSAIEQFADYAKHNKKLSEDLEEELAGIDDAGRLADTIAGALAAKVATKQALLTEPDPLKRLEMVYSVMEGELSVLQVERKIRGRVKRQMEKTQREYYLNEQLKAIQTELGGGLGAQLSRRAARLAVGQEEPAQEGHRARAAGPRRGSLCARQGQGPDRRVSRGAGADQQAEGADPVPRRPAGRGQDQPRQVARPRYGPRICAPVTGRRA